MSFSRELAAACLWDFGEDALIDGALKMTDEDLDTVQRLAAKYEGSAFPLPDVGQRISHGHVVAFAAVTHFEGHLRPLSRGRRRPQSQRPPALRS